MLARSLFVAGLSLVVALCSDDSLAAIVLVKNRPQPLLGPLLRNDAEKVTIRYLDERGRMRDETFPRSEVEEIVLTVSTERLAALDPAKPEMYRDYAEELFSKRRDPEAREIALRLYLIAARLAPKQLGPGAMAGMIALARSPAEQRKFRAAAYLLDPRRTKESLAPTKETRISPEETRTALELLRAMRLLRRGRGLEAREIVEKPEIGKLLESYDRIFPRAEFAAACGEAMLSSDRLRRTLLLELTLEELTGESRPEVSHAGEAGAWSRELRGEGNSAVSPLTLEQLTEFDPRKSIYREGRWIEPKSP